MIRNRKWDDRWIDLALHVADWSKDPSTKVGAVIVDHDRRPLGLGYNGFPRNVNDDPVRYQDKMVKYKLVVHSEANAIINSRGHDIRGMSMYVTKFPCSDCAKLIIQSGIDQIFCPRPSTDEPWATDSNFSQQMFSEAAVLLHYFRKEDLLSANPTRYFIDWEEKLV